MKKLIIMLLFANLFNMIVGQNAFSLYDTINLSSHNEDIFCFFSELCENDVASFTYNFTLDKIHETTIKVINSTSNCYINYGCKKLNVGESYVLNKDSLFFELVYKELSHFAFPYKAWLEIEISSKKRVNRFIIKCFSYKKVFTSVDLSEYDILNPYIVDKSCINSNSICMFPIKSNKVNQHGADLSVKKISNDSIREIKKYSYFFTEPYEVDISKLEDGLYVIECDDLYKKEYFYFIIF